MIDGWLIFSDVFRKNVYIYALLRISVQKCPFSPVSLFIGFFSIMINARVHDQTKSTEIVAKSDQTAQVSNLLVWITKTSKFKRSSMGLFFTNCLTCKYLYKASTKSGLRNA